MEQKTIDKEQPLLEYLLSEFKHLSRNSVKNLLTHKQIVVNNKIVTRHDFLLKKGDIITFEGKDKKCNLKIIYEDNLFLAVDKPYNLLTVATDKEKNKTAYVEVSKYLKSKNEKAYVLHRLDKDTSGVLIFCKNEKIKNDLQGKWNDIVTKREYIALVHGKIKNKKGTIKSYLNEDKTKFVYTTNKYEGKLAITEYEVIKENDKYSLVKINLLTGRKNQIRVQFSEMGNCLVGDKKYGENDSSSRLCLHASKVSLLYQNKEYIFESNKKEIFMKFFKK